MLKKIYKYKVVLKGGGDEFFWYFYGYVCWVILKSS